VVEPTEKALPLEKKIQNNKLSMHIVL